MPRHAPAVQAGLDRAVQDNVVRTALVGGVTFLLFAIMHVTPLGSGLASQIGGNLVGAAGLLGLVVYLRSRGSPLARPNAAFAGVFLWILAGDAFLTYTEHSAVSFNIGLFVMMLAGALMLSWPWLLVVLAGAAAEGLFVATLVPGGHLPTQVALEAAAGALALIIHANRVSALGRLEGLVLQEEGRRRAVEDAMAAVSTSEERFRRLAEASFEGLVIHREGRILDANPAFARMLGYTLDELKALTLLDLAAPSEREKVAERLRTLGSGTWETLGLRKDGTIFPIAISGRDLPYEGRRARVVTARDLTERRLAEEAAREQTVARRIVRRALTSTSAHASEVLAERRRLGRSIAKETGATSVERGLATFSTMGLGELWSLGNEGGKWTFAGHDMLDLNPGSRMPSCALALGYLEGLLSELEGHEMMGAELACESQGHPACRFVALPKPGLPGAPTVQAAAPSRAPTS